MEAIHVSDLPEPFAQAVKAVAETFRRQLPASGGANGEEPKKTPVEIPRWPLGVIGTLTRGEVYDDRV